MKFIIWSPFVSGKKFDKVQKKIEEKICQIVKFACFYLISPSLKHEEELKVVRDRFLFAILFIYRFEKREISFAT